MSKKLTPEQIRILNKAISDYKVNEDKEKKAKTRGKKPYDLYMSYDEPKLDTVITKINEALKKADLAKEVGDEGYNETSVEKGKKRLKTALEVYRERFGDYPDPSSIIDSTQSTSTQSTSTQSTSGTQQTGTQQPLVQQTPLERIKENYTRLIPQQITKHKNQLIERIIKEDNPNRHEAEVMANTIWEDASKGLPVIINSEKVIWTGEDPNKPSSWIKI